MVNAGSNGAVTWIDLSTPDVASAVEFYRALLGWSGVAESDTPMGRYYIGEVEGSQVAGLMSQAPEQAGMPALWTTFIYVDDIDGAVDVADGSGGTVLHKPFDIPGDAKVAVVADPTGAMLALFAGPVIEGEFYSQVPGRVCWVELLTRDPEAARPFYAEMFGWTSDAGSSYTMFELDGEQVAGMMTMPEQVPLAAPSHWAVYFAVDDCMATEERTGALGGEVLMTTTAVDLGKFAVLADPQGAKFNVMEFT